MNVLLSLLFAAFPLELDAGRTVPVEGRSPRLVMAGSTPTLVWVDERRRWLDGRDGGSLYLLELPNRGGGDTSSGRSIAGPWSFARTGSDGLAVAGSREGFVLVVWEDDGPERSMYRWLKRPSGQPSPPGKATGAGRPVAAAWSGDAGLMSWSVTGGTNRFFLLDSAAGFGGVGPALGASPVRLLSSGALADGGFLLAWAPDGGSWSRAVVTGTERAITPLETFERPLHLTVEPMGEGLAKVVDDALTVIDLKSGGSVRLPPLARGLSEAPSLARLGTGPFALGLSIPPNAIEVWLNESRLDTWPGAAVTLAPVGTADLLVVSTAPSGALEARSVFTAPTPTVSTPAAPAVIEAMRRSPAVAWDLDRWVLGWEEGSTTAPGTKLVWVRPDSSVGDWVGPLAGTLTPELAPDGLGGVLLTTREADLLTTSQVDRTSGPRAFVTSRSTGWASTRPGVLHFNDTHWFFSRSIGPVTSARWDLMGRQPRVADGLDGRAWVLTVEPLGGWKVAFFDPGNQRTTFSDQLQASAPGEPRSVISVRRSDTGEPLALAGILDQQRLAWFIVHEDGGVFDAGVAEGPGLRGMAVTATSRRWLRAWTLGEDVEVESLDDTGRVLASKRVEFEERSPGVPVLAAGRLGEVGLAVPILVGGNPRLWFDVLNDAPDLRDAGTDAGADAGEGSDDAGVSDAGPSTDGGVAPPDGGLEPLVFVPMACGCSQADGAVVSLLLVVLASGRRRRA